MEGVRDEVVLQEATAQALAIAGERPDRGTLERAMVPIEAALGPGTVHIAARIPRTPDNPLPYVVSASYTRNWLARYGAHRLHLIDPTVRYLLRTTRPFRWQAAMVGLEGPAMRRAHAMMHDAARHGLEDGWSFPVGSRAGLLGVVSVGGPCDYDWPDDVVSLLWGTFSTLFVRATADAAPPEMPSVPKREREVLILLAEGLTSRAIAERMSIAPNTVDWHIGQLNERLGARNRQHLMVLAMRMGLVS